MEQIAFRFEPARRVFGVAELNAAIHRLLEGEFADVWVTGEISGTRIASSGHYYFTLKEEDAQLRCVAFRQTARYLKFKPQDGVAGSRVAAWTSTKCAASINSWSSRSNRKDTARSNSPSSSSKRNLPAKGCSSRRANGRSRNSRGGSAS